jgi:hypothetical protein
MIDPQLQAVRWIKKLENGQGLFVSKINDEGFRKSLLECIQLGKPFLIEEAE